MRHMIKKLKNILQALEIIEDDSITALLKTMVCIYNLNNIENSTQWLLD